MWVNAEKNKYGIMLDIGAGNPDEGETSPIDFVKQDVEAYKDIDLVCNIKDLTKFVKENQCFVVRASHVMEHFSHKEIDEIFKIVHKILQPNGIFHISVPNLFAQAKKIIEQEDQEQIMVEIYGGQKDEFDYHKMGFTPKILKQILERNNFSVAKMLELDGIGWIDCKAKKNL